MRIKSLAAQIIVTDFTDKLRQIMPFVYCLVEQLLQTKLSGGIEHIGKSRSKLRVMVKARCLQKLATRFADQRHLHHVIHQFKMAGNIGLERELMEDRFTKGVDGLNLEPARRFQRPCKQTSRLCQPFRPGAIAIDLLDGLGQLTFVQCCPIGQSRKNAVLHDRCRRLGIGQAKNLGGIGSVEQQANDAFGQDMRLPRSGIGRNPDGILRIGCLVLIGDCFSRNVARRLHSPSPLSSAPPADHSSTRAR